MRRKTIGFIFVFITSSLGASRAEASSFPEYDIKAAYIYNFAKLVDWPAETMKGNAPIVLTILGRNPFGSSLETIENKLVGTHPIKVNFVSSVAEVNQCHILFICQSEAENLQEVLSALGNRPILTVSELEYFASNGGMIQFFNSHEKKVRFEINAIAAKGKGLRISSQLLKIARITGKEGDHEAQD